MAAAAHSRTDWSLLFAQPGFRYFFAGTFISMFGSGMNFAGVTWHILGITHSTVSVGVTVIMYTLPGLIVPFLGGVLIDRVDRRYLGMALDISRGTLVLCVAALVRFGHPHIWQIDGMVLLNGAGAAVYWASINALVQELVPPGQFVGANSSVLIAVQGGLLFAGAFVGFIYESWGLAGILWIDGLTYLVSAFCLYRLRRGYLHPRHSEAAGEALPDVLETAPIPPIIETDLAAGVLRDLREGLHYLREQPRVLALGITYATMLAGVISANVLVVALAKDVLHSGPRGFGLLESGWAIGAVTGGLAAGILARRRPLSVLVAATAILSVGHAFMPFVTLLPWAVVLQAVFGGCRALGGILTQSSVMALVPRRLMGRTQSAFSFISTTLQVLMSFSLGWVSQHLSIALAFGTLALLYAVAVVAAMRARGLNESIA
jgi:DHA3 family macrolide efflux protein-like MFS transporter